MPPRVLMTTDTIGGLWSYALDLAGGLAQSGTRTVLATLGRRLTDGQRADAAAVPGLILEESDFRLEWMPEVGEDVSWSGDWLLELERRHCPDIVHVNGYAHAALPWQAPCVAVAHSCVLSWWRAVHGEAAPAEWSSYARAVADGLRAAQVVVAPSAAYLSMLEQLYGPLPHGRVVHNGCDPALFEVGRKRDIVFSAGRVWDEAKNVAALEQVAARLPWPVIVAGDWRRPDGVGEPPAHLLCLNALERQQVRGWLTQAAIFALPARYEPFGLAVLEAALSGCALVLGDIPTLRELWTGAAVFVRPDDHAALQAAVEELIETPALRESLARAARARALRYSLERTVEGYRQVYLEALQPRPNFAHPPAHAPGDPLPPPSQTAAE